MQLLVAPPNTLYLCWAACALLIVTSDAKVHSEASVTPLEKKHRIIASIGKLHNIKLKQAWSAAEDLDGFPKEDSSSGDSGVMPQEDSADGPGSSSNISVPTDTLIDDNNIKPDPGTDDLLENPDFSIGTEMEVSIRLEYGFFDSEEMISAPSQDEVDGLIESTTRFYTDWFSDSNSTNITNYALESVELIPTTVAFIPDDEIFPILIEMLAHMKFSLIGENNELDELDILAAMATANYENYILSYVWGSEPAGATIFDETQRVYFTDSESTRAPAQLPTDVPTFAPTVSPAPSASAAPTMAPTITLSPTTIFAYEFSIRIQYGFFDDEYAGEVRGPTEDEILGLTEQTNSFFNDYIASTVSLSIVESFVFSEGTVSTNSADNEFSHGVTFPARLELGSKDSNVDSDDYLDEFIKILGAADYDRYITDYVWETGGIFVDVNQVFWDEIDVGQEDKKLTR